MASTCYSLATNHACIFSSRFMVPLPSHFSRSAPSNILQFKKTLKCMDGEQTSARRSGNYQRTIWKYDYIQSIKSDYSGNIFVERVAKLKEYVKRVLEKVEDPLEKLEMIHDLERLGVSYHFKDEITLFLKETYNSNNFDMWNKEGLYATSLRFKLLRQHGYKCPVGVFNKFKDENGCFRACLCKHTKGLLYLYEATFLSLKGESILKEAREYSTNYLKEGLKNKEIVGYLAKLVIHALELPLHWRMLRLEARWFIDVYEKRSDMNPLILKFAILDYNTVQAGHQEDLKQMSRWWEGTGFGEKLSFARDRLVENYLWTVGMMFEPQFQYCRRMSTKVNSLITTIDDVYDVYGTLEELELFTAAVERWDISAMDQLPSYMKICYFSLFNSTNEMAYDTLKEEGLVVIPYLRKAWVDICNAYLLEAKWYHTRYKPTLDEYLNNAWISISAPLMLVHCFVFVTKPLKKGNLEFLEKYHNIIKWSSMILRLSNDLGTSSEELKKGDVPKSIQCYMHETGASEEDARNHINHLINETWMKINEHTLSEDTLEIAENFMGIAMNLGRMARCMYQFGDGHASQDTETVHRVLSLLINPIPFMQGKDIY